MLLSLTTLIHKHNLRITGAIHVGAHYGEEVAEYMHNGIKDIILIEPCAKAFNILRNKYAAHHHIRLFNYACGTINGDAVMHIETANKGQSNSLLKPAGHLKHYPDIQFHDTELVQMRTLDSLLLDKKYNFLNMDVQGAEGHVLKGAMHTLHYIDYVYTEVNTEQLYENCILLEELDNMLSGFDRVEISMTGQGWGDALYVRKK